MNNIKKEKEKIYLIGKTYYIDPIKLGDMNDGIKGKRPIYILTGINNEWVFGVLSTTTIHSGKKNTFQHKEYLKWRDGCYLRKDRMFGWTRVEKKDIKNDKKNLKKVISLNEKQKKELLSFYKDVINNQKESLK
ncbi:MAG: hypothetical protein TYPL_1800 [Candidatus Tyloplasma litorale]|nr:MAG: hypothetical protein TYPL_1800 [Mycoplasmatales bacterium]